MYQVVHTCYLNYFLTNECEYTYHYTDSRFQKYLIKKRQCTDALFQKYLIKKRQCTDARFQKYLIKKRQ